MQDAKVEARIRRKFRLVAVELDERRRRQWAAVEARELGWGGISLVARATGLSRPTIMAGLKDLRLPSKSRTAASARVRCPGGFHRRGQPVISVDTKKKELVGEFKNPGEEWHPHGQPETVNVHDFPDPKLGKAIPYGVYDLAGNEGWVSVGIDHDTAEFACASIQRWWNEMGSVRFPRATELLITADGGGSNSSRNRLWKKSLQSLADELDMTLRVCHFPPGTSKWNKIEHRLFCFITKNWRGRPLTTYEVIVNLIASTTTKTGLTVRAALDPHRYETGIAVSDEELARLRITPAKFHGNWNYSIKPRQKNL